MWCNNKGLNSNRLRVWCCQRVGLLKDRSLLVILLVECTSNNLVWLQSNVCLLHPCRIAYLDFDNQDSVTKALELSGSDLGGYELFVDAAKPKGDGQRGGGRSGGRSGGRFGDRSGGRRGGGRFGDRSGGRDGGRFGRGGGGRGGNRGGGRGFGRQSAAPAGILVLF